MAETPVDADLSEEEQVVAALVAGGAAFAALGGATLMLTEAVENSDDAILDMPRREGSPIHGEISVEIDRLAKEARVIDNGTGILEPVHVLKKPFKSLRRNVDYAHGQFGRGLQAFRGFCQDLQYITRREHPSPEEAALDRGGESGNTVRLHLVRDSARGTITPVNEEEFRDYCGYATGTAAVYSNWLPGEFERLDPEQLATRMQHHFGELIRRGEVTIGLKVDEKEIPIEPRVYNPDHRIDIPARTVTDGGGRELGKIEFNLYYCSQDFQHEYKRPYLLVDGRPLGDSFISLFPEFQGQPVWSSHYMTGYVSCDFIAPNELRLALMPGEAKDLFVRALRDTALDIQRMVQDFQRRLFDQQLRTEMNDLVVDVQRFLRNEHVFDFRPTASSGLLNEADSPGAVAAQPAAGELPTVSRQGAPEPLLSGIIPHADTPGTPRGPERPPGPARGGNPDGTRETEEPVDPRLRGHVPARRRLRRPSGFPLEFEPNELSPEMSWFETAADSVVVNSEHLRFKYLQERSIDRGTNSTFYTKLRTYVTQRYLWEIVTMASARAGTGREEAEKQFWDLNYKFFETR